LSVALRGIFRVVWSSGGLPAIGDRRVRSDGSEIAAIGLLL
jgi:hypothetical protein